MNKKILVIITCFFAVFLSVSAVFAATVAATYGGRIISDAQNKSEAWYVDPVSQTRYALNTADEAALIIRKLGVGISEGNFQKISQVGMASKGNLVLARKLAGKILIQVEGKGEAWYVNPVNLKKYPLGNAANSLSVWRGLAVAIDQTALAKIPKAVRDENVNNLSSFKFTEKVSTAAGVFSAAVAEIDLNKLTPKIITDTAGVENCSLNCLSKNLADYAFDQKAFAAINGVYGAPFYNTRSQYLVNANKLSASQPLIAFDANNKFYYYPSSNRFSAKNFAADNGAALSAAFVGRVKLVENGQIKPVAASVRIVRNAFGFKKASGTSQGSIFLVSARNVTLSELAKVMKSLGADYAVSLDSGAFSALFYGDEYKVGPGSNVPNAILFVAK